MKKYFSLAVAVFLVVFVFQFKADAQLTESLAITSVRAENIVGSGAQIKWLTNLAGSSKVYYGTTTAGMTLASDSRCDNGTAVLEHCVNLMNLEPGKTYYYKIETTTTSGMTGSGSGYTFTSASGASNTSGTIMNPPAAPTNLIARQEGAGGSVNLQWMDHSETEANFKVSYMPSGGAWTYLAALSPNITGYTFYNQAWGSYSFKVEACNSAGCSASNVVSLNTVSSTTNIAPTPTPTPTNSPATTPVAAPLAPTGLTHSLSPSGAAYITWNASERATYYKLWRTPGWGTQNWMNLFALSTTDHSLVPGTTYQYKITAVSSVNGYDYQSSFSNPIYVSAGNATVSPTPLPTSPTPTPIITQTPFPSTSISPSPSPSVTPIVSQTPIPTPTPMPVYESVKTLSGAVLFSNGQPVTDAEVGAYSRDTGLWKSAFSDSSGNYSLKLSGGRWQLGARPKDPVSAKWRFDQFLEVSFALDNNPETKTSNIAISSFDSKLSILVTDNSGNPIPGVGVNVSNFSAASSNNATQSIGTMPADYFYGKTDSSGKAFLNLKAGSYYVRAFLPDSLGYINPEEQAITLSAGESKEVKISFIKRDTVFAIYIKGVTRLEDGTPTDAYISAWSEKGRSASVRSSANGEFSLQVSPNDKWHIGAGKMVGNIPYQAAQIIVPVETQTVSVELILARHEEVLPDPVTVTRTISQEIITQSNDGARVTVPANSVATGGSLTVEMKPTIEAPSQPAAKVIGTVYDIEVKNTSGQQVKTFDKDLEVILPYTEADLAAQGLTEDTLVPNYFDETTNTWVKVDNYTIDKEKNVVIARVKHLTRFALVSPADVTPPLPPSSVAASALGQGKIKISWVNPAKDFSHAKVYRSESSGSLGKLVASEVTGAEFTDESEIQNGVTYYYVVRAVDPAGNETSNTSPVSVKASGTSSAALKEGDMISAAGSNDPDIYIINEHGYKRLFLNPAIFNFYGHLGGFSKVKNVTASARDGYKTSGLFRNCETNDPKIYGVEVSGEDAGVLHWVNTSGEQAVAEDPDFFKKTFCINNNEFNWYQKSSAYTSVKQIPAYNR